MLRASVRHRIRISWRDAEHCVLSVRHVAVIEHVLPRHHPANPARRVRKILCVYVAQRVQHVTGAQDGVRRVGQTDRGGDIEFRAKQHVRQVAHVRRGEADGVRERPVVCQVLRCRRERRVTLKRMKTARHLRARHEPARHEPAIEEGRKHGAPERELDAREGRHVAPEERLRVVVDPEEQLAAAVARELLRG